MFLRLKFFVLSFVSILIGLKVTMRNIFAPAVTLQYPKEKRPMAENFRGMVDLIPEDCVVCYMCIKICPVAALDLTHKQSLTADNKKKLDITKFTFNGELCCFCGLCEEICPTDAIYLNKMYEVSVFSHDDVNNIDLMNAEKYKHLDKYDLTKYTKKG
ncbi:MAG: 4Fe-4S binding protein [Candidatus Omnitrophota bacterium]